MHMATASAISVTITGANGYSVTGRALMDFAGTYPQGYQLVSNRDALVYQGDYTVTPHLTAQIGFRFEDERGTSRSFYAIERTNYDYRAAVHGDFKNRFFYTLGGDLEHYSLFGVQTTPRAGVSFYAFRPRKGVLSGTRMLFNFGDAVREPSRHRSALFALHLSRAEWRAGDHSADAHHADCCADRAHLRRRSGAGILQPTADLPDQLLPQRIWATDRVCGAGSDSSSCCQT